MLFPRSRLRLRPHQGRRMDLNFARRSRYLRCLQVGWRRCVWVVVIACTHTTLSSFVLHLGHRQQCASVESRRGWNSTICFGFQRLEPIGGGKIGCGFLHGHFCIYWGGPFSPQSVVLIVIALLVLSLLDFHSTCPMYLHLQTDHMRVWSSLFLWPCLLCFSRRSAPPLVSL